MKKIIQLGLVIFALFAVLIPVASAAEFIAPSSTDGGTVVVGTGETHRNLYIAGGNVFINGPTQGDLFAGGGNVVIDGAVEQDLTVGGGNVTVNGRVGGDLRAGGGTVIINSEVVGDVLIGGGTVRLSDKAVIRGDLIMGAGEANIEAPVSGSVRLGTGNAFINSAIAGTVTIRHADKVTFGPKASIPGKISIRAKNEPVIQQGAQVSTPEFSKREDRGGKDEFAGIFSLWFIIKIAAYIIAAWLVTYLVPRRSMWITQNMKDKFAANLGIGLISVIVVPILSLIALFTLIGYYVALIALVWFVMVLLMGCLLGAVFTGSYIVNRWVRKQDLRLDWQSVVVGGVVYVLLGLIPVLGWIIQTVLALVAIGSIMRLSRENIKSNKVIQQ